jgi:hypothetical protein
VANLQQEIARRHEAAKAAIVIPTNDAIERMPIARLDANLKALPSDFTLITITGKFIDLAGNPCTGTVTFSPNYSSVLDDQVNLISIVPIVLTAALDGTGAISINLPATDDPDIVPRGWSYTVKYNFAGFTQTYSIAVPYNGGSIDLSTVNPVTPVANLDSFVTYGDLDSAVGAGIDSVLIISATPPTDTTAIWIDTTT